MIWMLHKQYCEELVFKLVLLAQTFISIHSLQSVTICEFLPRQKTRHITVEKYNYFKRITNKFTKNELVSKLKINFWKIKGVKESFGYVKSYARSDGTWERVTEPEMEK